MTLKPWKWQKWQNLEVNSQFYSLNMLLVLSAKYYMRALSERKKNFASASWAPLFYWKVSADLSAARDFQQWARVERRSFFGERANALALVRSKTSERRSTRAHEKVSGAQLEIIEDYCKQCSTQNTILNSEWLGVQLNTQFWKVSGA